MKIIDRYIFRNLIPPFFYCTFAFVLLFIVGSLFEELDEFLSREVPFKVILQYYLYSIPSIYVWTAPLALLLSTMYLMAYMNRYREITCLLASGISRLRITVPFVVIGVVASISVFIINESVVPDCARNMRDIKTQYMKEEKGTQKEKITHYSSKYNASFYIEKFEKNKGKNLSIREFDEEGECIREWYGEECKWVDGKLWIFSGFIRKKRLGEKELFDTVPILKMELPFKVGIEDLQLEKLGKQYMMLQFMGVSGLIDYIRRNFRKDTVPRYVLVELYRQMSLPVTVLIMLVFALIFGMRTQEGNVLTSVGASLGIYLAYYGISNFLLSLGKLGKILPGVAVWTPMVLFCIIAIYFLQRFK